MFIVTENNSGCLGTEVEEGEISSGYKESFEGDGYVHYLHCGDYSDLCTHVSKLLSNCTLYIPQLYLYQCFILIYTHQLYLQQSHNSNNNNNNNKTLSAEGE